MKVLCKNSVVVWGAASLHLPFLRNSFKLLIETAQNVMARHRAVFKLATRNFVLPAVLFVVQCDVQGQKCLMWIARIASVVF